MKLKVGQVIYLKPTDIRRSGNIREVTISKISRKYFEVEEMSSRRFHIDSLKHDGGDISPQWQGYLSLKEIKDEEEFTRLQGKIVRHSWVKYDCSLEDLKKACELLNINTEA